MSIFLLRLPLEVASREAAASVEGAVLPTPQLQDAIAALGASLERFAINGIDFDVLGLNQFDQELGRLTQCGVEPHLLPCSGHCHVEQPSLFGEGVRIRRRHGQLQRGVVLDLTRETTVALHHVEDEHVLGLQSL